MLKLLKTASKRAIQKTGEATCDLIENEITDRIRKVSKLHHRIVQRHLKVKQKIYLPTYIYIYIYIYIYRERDR